MKNHLPPSERIPDPEFDRFLRRSGGGMRLPVFTDREVWRRIEIVENEAAQCSIAWRLDAFLSTLLRPAYAAAMIALAAAGGLWLGARVGTPASEGKLAYVQAISPFQHKAGQGQE